MDSRLALISTICLHELWQHNLILQEYRFGVDLLWMFDDASRQNCHNPLTFITAMSHLLLPEPHQTINTKYDGKSGKQNNVTCVPCQDISTEFLWQWIRKEYNTLGFIPSFCHCYGEFNFHIIGSTSSICGTPPWTKTDLVVITVAQNVIKVATYARWQYCVTSQFLRHGVLV